MTKTTNETNSRKKTEEQIHYENLQSFFKWVITIVGSVIAIMATVSLFFTYNNMKDNREELKQALDEAKSEIKEMVSNANITIKETKDQSNLTSNNVKFESLQTIKDLESEAQKSIIDIKDYAKSLALYETERKVSEAFNDNNIQRVIDEAAKKEIETRVIGIITSSFQQIPNFILAVDKIRAGDRKSFIYMDSIAKNSKDQVYQSMAKKVIKEKTRDYENSIQDVESLTMIEFLKMELSHLPVNMWNFNPTIDATEAGCRKLFNETKKDIEENENLNYVALDFKILRFLTNIHIPMFDFEAAKEVTYIIGIPHPK